MKIKAQLRKAYNAADTEYNQALNALRYEDYDHLRRGNPAQNEAQRNIDRLAEKRRDAYVDWANVALVVATEV
jgi:hypothetical protein